MITLLAADLRSVKALAMFLVQLASCRAAALSSTVGMAALEADINSVPGWAKQKKHERERLNNNDTNIFNCLKTKKARIFLFL